MAALSYDTLGTISGVSSTNKVAASSRSRDRNDKQRLSFRANPLLPFSGIVHVQATVGDPTATDNIWFDIAEMQINNEGGSWSYEPQGEFASIRATCKAGNYYAAATGTDGATVTTTGTFTINGTTVSVTAADAIPAIVTNITALGITNIVAELFTNSTNVNGALRIYSTDGSDVVLVDVTNTPLADLGITAGTFTSGTITSIAILR
jgi:hypothetical protein